MDLGAHTGGRNMLKPFRLRVGNFQFFNGLEGGGEVVTETVPPSDLGGELTPRKVQEK